MLRELLDKYFLLKKEAYDKEAFSRQSAAAANLAAIDFRNAATELAEQIKKLSAGDRYVNKGILFEHDGKTYSLETNPTASNVWVHELFSPEEADKFLMIEKLRGN